MKIIYLISFLALLVSCAGSEENSILSKKPSQHSAAMIEADNLFKKGAYQKAAKIYESNLVDAKSDDIRFLYAESLRLAGDMEVALEQYDTILKNNVDSLDAIEGKALIYVAKGEFKKAASLFSYIVNKDAIRWRTINALGVIYATTGHLDESLKYYNIALDISDNNPSVLNNMGLSIAFSGDKEKGIKIISKALDSLKEADVKKLEQIEYNLALVYGISGKMDKAEEILNKYLTKPQVMNNLGFYAQLSDDESLAKTYLSKALASSPVYYEKAWNNLQNID